MFFKPGYVVTVKTDKGYFMAKVWARGPTDCVDEELVNLSFACHATVHFGLKPIAFLYARPFLLVNWRGILVPMTKFILADNIL